MGNLLVRFVKDRPFLMNRRRIVIKRLKSLLGRHACGGFNSIRNKNMSLNALCGLGSGTAAFFYNNERDKPIECGSMKIEFTGKATEQIAKIKSERPDLVGLLTLRIEALLTYPPEKWFRLIHHKGTGDRFVAETGQKIHLTGWISVDDETVYIEGCEIHE